MRERYSSFRLIGLGAFNLEAARPQIQSAARADAKIKKLPLRFWMNAASRGVCVLYLCAAEGKWLFIAEALAHKYCLRVLICYAASVITFCARLVRARFLTTRWERACDELSRSAQALYSNKIAFIASLVSCQILNFRLLPVELLMTFFATRMSDRGTPGALLIMKREPPKTANIIKLNSKYKFYLIFTLLLLKYM